MRIDPSQTLNAHDAEHFCQALLAVQQARSLSGHDLDRLCFLPLGTTSALLRRDRAIHVRYMLRYCKDLDIVPEKPWGVPTCQYCVEAVPIQEAQSVEAACALATEDALLAMAPSERWAHIVQLCTLLMREVEMLNAALSIVTAPGPFPPAPPDA